MKKLWSGRIEYTLLNGCYTKKQRYLYTVVLVDAEAFVSGSAKFTKNTERKLPPAGFLRGLQNAKPRHLNISRYSDQYPYGEIHTANENRIGKIAQFCPLY